MFGIIVVETQAGLTVFRVMGSTFTVSVGTIPSRYKPMPEFKKSCSALAGEWGMQGICSWEKRLSLRSGLEEEARLNSKRSLTKL